eukprot:1517975-Amphidinium_carterae.1
MLSSYRKVGSRRARARGSNAHRVLDSSALYRFRANGLHGLIVTVPVIGKLAVNVGATTQTSAQSSCAAAQIACSPPHEWGSLSLAASCAGVHDCVPQCPGVPGDGSAHSMKQARPIACCLHPLKTPLLQISVNTLPSAAGC